MDHFFTRNSMGRVFGFLEVSSVRKNWKIYPNFKIPEIFGFLDLGLSLEPDTWLYLFGHGISQTQPMWGHTQNFSSFGPLILHLPGGGWISPPPSLKCVAGTPSLLGLNLKVYKVLKMLVVFHTMPGGTSTSSARPVKTWRGPPLTVLIHTVECKIVGPLNYWLRNFAEWQIFDVKFANI